MSTWTFITNHARVMMVISQDPTVRLRDIASTLDITERAAQRIVTELVDEGYLSRKREGRRNTYTVHPEAPLRSTQVKGTTIGDLMALLVEEDKPLRLAS
jgi:DNA-binding IclR family transcriptional regulator